MDKCKLDSSKCKKAFFDFGTIATGTVSHKYFKITNDNKVKRDYEVQRDPTSNPIDYVFLVEPTTSSVEPGASFVFKIQFAPSVPFTIIFDYFNIIDANSVCLKFGVKGKSIGPAVVASAKKLTLVCTGPMRKTSKTIELTNDSGVPASYQFDIDNKQCVFKVDNTHGIIKPNKYTYVTIKFVPTGPGIYSKYLYCIIHYQHPIIIDLVGICSCSALLQDDISLLRFPMPEPITGGYEGYICDGVCSTEHRPPVVLNMSHVDFGQTNVEGTQNIPCAVSVTNHIKRDILISWEKDVEEVFKIEPNSTIIPMGQSSLFEVFFRPSKPDLLYNRELVALIYWGEFQKSSKDFIEREQIHVPFSISLSLIGHSFPENSYGWMPQYQMEPRRLVLPACCPPIPVYNTFVLKRFGHLPLMFKFISPPITNYNVKPMQGLITNDYQLIVVQLCPENKEESAYIERWGLQFNGFPQYEICVDFCAYAENPIVQIGLQNTVLFPPTFPLCEQSAHICMKNLTRHSIRYKFILPNDNNIIDISEESGVIAANEIIYTLWKFHPTEDKNYMIDVKCETYALQYCAYPIGVPAETWVTAYGDSEDTDLVAFPSVIECGALVYGEKQEKSFHLFNFSHCRMHFKLMTIQDSISNSSIKDDVVMFNINDTIEGGGKAKIHLSVSPSDLGDNDIVIAYQIRFNSRSSEVIQRPHKPIVTVRYNGILPKLRICDLKYTGAGRMFSKVALWTMMNINRLNNLLNTLPANSENQINMFFPHAVIGHCPLTVFLLLKNHTDVTSSWNLKRHKTCSCKLLTKSKGLSRRSLSYECPHRPLFTIHPTSGKLMAKQDEILTFTLKYDLLGATELSYMLKLSNGRRILLTAQVVSLPLDNCTPSAYTSAMVLKDIFIGDLCSIIQPYWLYNSGTTLATYEVDVTPLIDMNIFEYNVNILSCLNPKGVIPSKASYPLLFKFSPIALKTYDVTVPIYLHPDWYDLKIMGDGVINSDTDYSFMHCKAPDVRSFVHPELPIELSIDHIMGDPFLTHSKVEKLFFLENFSTTMVIGYVWHIYNLPSILMCHVTPNRGSLQPGEKHTCKLVALSRSRSCLLTVSVVVELLNMTERRNHEKSLFLYQSMKRRIKDQFTMTESGITYPEVNMDILPSPVPFYQTLAVTCCIHCIKDVDSKMSLRDQLKQYPGEEVELLDFETVPQQNTNEISVVKNFLERIIWEVVDSLWFKNNIRKIKEESNPYYCQFKMNENERERLNGTSYIVPKRQETDAILCDIIYDIVHDHFNLGMPRKTEKQYEAHRLSALRAEMMENVWRKYCLDNPILPRLEKIKVPIGW